MKKTLLAYPLFAFFVLFPLFAECKDPDKKGRRDPFLDVIGMKGATAIGYQKLTNKERAALRRLFFSLNRSDSLDDVANQRMKDEGWTPVQVLATVTQEGTNFIVVETSILSKWAIEAPFFANFPKGNYWAVTSPFSGVSRMIDGAGREHLLTSSKNFELK